MLDMHKEYDLKAGKYGRVYVFPDKVSQAMAKPCTDEPDEPTP